MRLTVKHWKRILFLDSQDVDESCGWQKNNIRIYRWMNQVQDMVEGRMELSEKDNNDNRICRIAKEKYNDSGRHVVGLLFEGINILSSYGTGMG